MKPARAREIAEATGERCIVCAQPATLLCDFVLGFQIGRTLPYPAVDSTDAQMYTCDAPLCRECATFAGNQFLCGTKAVTGVESVDYCPIHSPPDREQGPPITASDAEYLRRQAWAGLRRRAMMLTPGIAT